MFIFRDIIDNIIYTSVSRDIDTLHMTVQCSIQVNTAETRDNNTALPLEGV